MPRCIWLTLTSFVLMGCGSDESAPAPTSDATTDGADVSIVTDATDAADARDTTPIDVAEEAPACTLSGACFDDFIPHQKAAAACFGHFGAGCGTFDGTKTKCRWEDGAGFDVVKEDGGGSSIVYLGTTGEECFRRLSTGDLVFPGAPPVSYTSAVKTTPDPSENTLTIGCKAPTGTFTCKIDQCIDCGIDVRTCCS